MIIEIISANMKIRFGRYLLHALVHVRLTRWFDIMQELQSFFYLVSGSRDNKLQDVLLHNKPEAVRLKSATTS